MNDLPCTSDFDTLASQAESVIEDLLADVVALRRVLHAHPEPSGEEYETVRHISAWLDQHDLAADLAVDERGLLLNLGDGALPGCFALRADLDALRIQDQKHVHYRSQVDNVMHACGHDVHAAILAGAMVTINLLQRQDQLAWPFNIRGIFQPAEETCQGAKDMIAAEALAGVGTIMALHVDPIRPVGTVAIRPGVMTASCDEVIVTIHGRGGHAARPHHTKDPIAAVAQFINAVHVQLPRGTDSLDTIVIGFGRITGGEQCNVIPDAVELRGTLRTLVDETRTQAIEQLHEIAAGIGRATQTQIDVKLGIGTPPVNNDHALTEHIDRAARRLFGSAVEIMERPSMGAEDFAYYLDHVPGALVRIGTLSPGATPTGLHTPHFDVDEAALGVGIKLLVQAALEWSASAH